MEGTFSPHGVTTSVPLGDGVGWFQKLETKEGGKGWRERKWVFRLEKGGEVEERREPRSWGVERSEMILEWGVRCS